MSVSRTPQCIATTCAYCGVGCGVDIALEEGKPVSLEGTREHPANYGRLCVKGTHLLDTTGPEERLLEPSIKGTPVSWSSAINEVATRFKTIITEHGKDAVAFYVSGQLLTEDYYVANKLMKGYIGSANIDTNSRLCMSSAVSAYKRAFGEDVVPCDYSDLEQTELLVLVGSNAAWTHPVLFQRIERAKKLKPNMKIVVIDPRRTASVALADMHLQLAPGTDAAIFNGLLRYASENNALDHSFIEKHTNGFKATMAACSPWTLEHVASFCDLDIDDLTRFYEWFCLQPKVISFYSMGVNQSSTGVDKCNSIINCHLATGKLLYPGAGPFSITGQPNAMGGREVGGLANQLAAHLDIDNAAHREATQSFWQSPTIADQQGQKALDMFDAIADGRIKAVWVMATNPLVSLPNRNKIEKALAACDCVVVSDCVSKNDTLQHADIVLPSSGWLEKDGTVTNSERTISRQRGIVPPPGEARHDWQIICDVAQAMGFSGFDFTGPHAIFDEWVRMTAQVNGNERQLNLGSMAGRSKRQYDNMRPSQWPFNDAGESRPVFEGNKFSTADGKANLLAITPQLPVQATNDAYPLTMNSGRMRDQWHTMTRTGRAAALSEHSTFPTIQVHPDTALEYGIEEGDIVEAVSSTGCVQAYASITDAVRRASCFMPIHWNKQFASMANVSNLYDSIADPLSGQPESKQAAVNLTKPAYQHFVSLFSVEPVTSESPFWVKSKRPACEHKEMAFACEDLNLATLAPQWIALQGEWISAKQGDVQVSILIKQKKLLCAAFAFTNRQTQITSLPAAWVESCFNEALTFADITSLLSAKPDESFTKGRLVCSCFKVHENTIVEAVSAGCTSVNALGKSLQCGTNCGSCKSELQQIINENSKVDSSSIRVREVS